MSRILWINPLGTSVFDATIGAELRRVKRPNTDVEVRSLKRGPHHLEYHAYESWVTPDLLTTIVAAEREGFDAAVIGSPPLACRLAPRCPFAKDRCRQEKQVLRPVNDHHQVACWRAAAGEISTDDFERSRLALEV